MNHRLLIRRLLLAGALTFLVRLAWEAFSGGLRQLPRARTAGQKVETAVQLECGLLSLLVVLTCFWRRQWALPVRRLWSVSLAAAAGLSSIVWGPPMPYLGIFFVAAALLMARCVQWVLRMTLLS